MRIRHSDFINSVWEDFDKSNRTRRWGDEVEGNHHHKPCQTRMWFDSTIYPSPTGLLASLAPLNDLKSNHYDLLQYYIFQFCPATTASRATISPFASLITPLFAHGGQPWALLSVLALAARHRSLRNVGWDAVAMSLKGKALRALLNRTNSNSVSDASDIFLDPQVLVAMMFLCLYEIMDNCDHRWVVHLRASQKFLHHARRYKRKTIENNDLSMFVERFFLLQDVISRTACGEQSLFNLDYWQNLSPESSNNPCEWSSCTPAISRLIFRTTELSRQREKGSINLAEFHLQAAYLKSDIWTENGRTGPEHNDLVRSRSVGIQKASMVLYYHCLIEDALPTTPIVVRLVSYIIQGVSSLVSAGCVADLVFPLFTAAVELDPLRDDEQYLSPTSGDIQVSGRKAVIDILDAIAGLAMANTLRIGNIIRKVWRLRDLSQADSRGEQDNETTFSLKQRSDWNIYVSPYCASISLL